jgi:hypothetical protein
LIVVIGVSSHPPDVEHLDLMLERTIANTGQVPKTFITDAGYWSEANATSCAAQGADPHIATVRQNHGQPTLPTRGPIAKDLDEKGKMTQRVRNKKGREIYDRRKTIVEPVCGQTLDAVFSEGVGMPWTPTLTAARP